MVKMVVPNKMYRDRREYDKKNTEYIMKLFKCDSCINRCDDISNDLNCQEYIVDGLFQCPCFAENDI